MKLSVSVPDELWRDVHPINGMPSKTIQQALRLLQAERAAHAEIITLDLDPEKDYIVNGIFIPGDSTQA